ncbi:unnamed protein product [Rotaria magnacalcarata]|uniref:Uncharacterized protein n=1 Tax=Rotaria magnacalcarata TaxID=392030 RepID=A0A8S3C6X9_9BILA|nr:unnamed protein product [Rotaria magnacalcarata]CAF4892743.1 unnamed protein product [Rotaria magnacalcarata]
MNNTASISIMLPVALAVVRELGIYSENFLNRQQAAVINGGFLLAVAYSSSIDGLSRHISDGTATIFCGILSLILPDSNPFNRKILFSTFTLNETNADKR